MTSIFSLANRVLPFATPGTPLLQDILHLAALCILLYFAPQIQQWVYTWRTKGVVREEAQDVAQNGTANGTREVHPEVDLRVPNTGQDFQGINDQVDVVDNLDHVPGQDLPANFDLVAEEGQPGVARGHEVIPHRNVGAKKAKSLARKDQRRAYNEFMRSQGDAQRAKDAEGAEEREAALAAEKERRKLAELELGSRRAKEREAKREREELQRKETARMTDLALSTVRDELDSRRTCDLFQVAKLVGDDVDEEWVENVLRASGMIGKKGYTITMITGMGWAVRVTEEDMAALYNAAVESDLGDDDGRISNEALGELFERLLKTAPVHSSRS